MKVKFFSILLSIIFVSLSLYSQDDVGGFGKRVVLGFTVGTGQIGCRLTMKNFYRMAGMQIYDTELR